MENKSTKSKVKFLLWILLPIAVGIFLASNISNIAHLKFPSLNKISGVAKTAAVAEAVEDEDKQSYFFTNKSETSGPKISAEAYLVGDLLTGEVVLAKNQNKKMPIASVSKVMTALLSDALAKPSDTSKVSSAALATYGGNGSFRIGESISTKDLLYPLLLQSSNDAAEILAETFDRESFIHKMNEEADALTLESTSFEDPTGLSRNNQSTVSDLFKLAGYIFKEKPELWQLTTKRSYANKVHHWSSTNQFLSTAGYLGGKSGYTDPAGQTVISLFSLPLSKDSERPLAIVLLKSADRHKDVETLLKYLKKNIYYGGVADKRSDWVKEKIGLPDITEPDFVTLTFGGDLMLDRGVRSSVVRNFSNDYSALFEKLSFLKERDIVFANLEGTASDLGKDLHNLYSFQMDPDVIPALAGAGINVLSVANNHVGDWGRESYSDTLIRLTENEIAYAGGGANSALAEEPTIVEKHGVKIGFLAFSDVGPDWMKATETQAGLLLASNPRFDEIIQNASKKVDYLIVSFHFGDEYKTVHNARQEYLAHLAVDDGAKLVIGAHPHVVEDTEIYKDSLIAYSLGNFIFDQSWSAPTMQGMLLNVKLWENGQMDVSKDTVKLNSAFQPDQVIKGKEERIKFAEPTVIKN